MYMYVWVSVWVSAYVSMCMCVCVLSVQLAAWLGSRGSCGPLFVLVILPVFMCVCNGVCDCVCVRVVVCIYVVRRGGAVFICLFLWPLSLLARAFFTAITKNYRLSQNRQLFKEIKQKSSLNHHAHSRTKKGKRQKEDKATQGSRAAAAAVNIVLVYVFWAEVSYTLSAYLSPPSAPTTYQITHLTVSTAACADILYIFLLSCLVSRRPHIGWNSIGLLYEFLPSWFIWQSIAQCGIINGNSTFMCAHISRFNWRSFRWFHCCSLLVPRLLCFLATTWTRLPNISV